MSILMKNQMKKERRGPVKKKTESIKGKDRGRGRGVRSSIAHDTEFEAPVERGRGTARGRCRGSGVRSSIATDTVFEAPVEWGRGMDKGRGRGRW